MLFKPVQIGTMEVKNRIVMPPMATNFAATDGKVMRVPIPSLTEERRKQLVKKVNGLGEEAKTAIRLLRRDANEELKKLQKDGELAEDDARRATEDVQKRTDKYVAEIDTLCKNKEKELMEV